MNAEYGSASGGCAPVRDGAPAGSSFFRRKEFSSGNHETDSNTSEALHTRDAERADFGRQPADVQERDSRASVEIFSDKRGPAGSSRNRENPDTAKVPLTMKTGEKSGND